MSLILTGAIKEKYSKFQDYLKKGVVSTDDVLIIAIGMGGVRDIDLADHYDTPILFRATLGLDGIAMTVPIGQNSDEKQIGTVQTYKSEIKKNTGTPIPTNGFLNQQFPLLSGIIYSIARFVDCPNCNTSKRITVLHNPDAKQKLSMGGLSSEQEFFVDFDSEGNAMLRKFSNEK
jgi:hypothetical protein